jgi:GT2 family glycosyltransferase
MTSTVTVAVPTLNAGPGFGRTLAAIRAQQVDHSVQLLICDSGSEDGTVGLARSEGARVIEIAREDFSHGATRNLLMSEAGGDHVAFLTQDAVPAADNWLASLLRGFALADDVGMTFGPYRPRPDASVSVARELTTWFGSFSDGGPRVDALEPSQRAAPPRDFLGPLGFFSDANGCLAHAAWERVPFRPIAYAEDHLLAQDMLRAGFAKVYMPEAAVIHSHEYSLGQWMRRSFDETRAIREVYGRAPGGEPRTALRNLRGNVMSDWRWTRTEEPGATRLSAELPALVGSLAHHGARTVGAVLGAHAPRLPPRLVAQLSLEGRR